MTSRHPGGGTNLYGKSAHVTAAVLGMLQMQLWQHWKG